MTRINTVQPQELNNKMLMGELHEITRIYNLVRKAQDRGINQHNYKHMLKQPSEYTLGTGHVKFFFSRLDYITKRYYALNAEAKQRGYNVNPINEQDLVKGIDKWWFGSYTPTKDSIKINRQRIAERLEAINSKK